MMPQAARVVFDCNVLLQALASPHGPSGQCLAAVIAGRLTLVVSPAILQEFTEVALRPRVAQKLAITPPMVQQALVTLRATALLLNDVPPIYTVPDDPDDSVYINTALAARAIVVTTRDDDLLRLMDASSPAGRDFASRFPHVQVLTPVGLLAHLRD
jgi:putative PIN family toxin of toxin-antitoxin system